MKSKNVIDRFMSHVEKSNNGCWNWTSTKSNSKGYGYFSVTRNHKALAHRISYTLFVGDIPSGLTIDHLCRNKLCVNPNHLEPVTILENTRRSLPYRYYNLIKYCRNGHKRTFENTRIRSSGFRDCLDCKKVREMKKR